MYIARSAELRTARADLAQARAKIAELEKIERGLNAENSRLLTSNADMRAVVEAAQKFFGRSGERWFDRADCALLQRTVSVGLGNNTCTCGGHELSRSLKTLDAARETDG